MNEEGQEDEPDQHAIERQIGWLEGTLDAAEEEVLVLRAENARLRADLEVARTERDDEAREAEMWRERYEETITLQVVVDVDQREAT